MSLQFVVTEYHNAYKFHKNPTVQSAAELLPIFTEPPMSQ